MRIILASASPRRLELLGQIGISCHVSPADIDENLPKGLPAEIAVMELASLKAGHVASQEKEEALVIGADTVVVLDGEIIGKPKDKEDAKRILSSLSDREHQVYTGICVMRTTDGKMAAQYEKSTVFFRELTDKEIEGYIKTNEPMDKAGAYGIQGMGSLFVEKIEGDYNNIVGLPICRLYDILRSEFDVELL